jgi:hypothetical protein
MYAVVIKRLLQNIWKLMKRKGSVSVDARQTKKGAIDNLCLESLERVENPRFLTSFAHYILPLAENTQGLPLQLKQSTTSIQDPNHLCVIVYIPCYLRHDVADFLFLRLQSTIAWSHGPPIKIFGKLYQQPRMIAFYGDADRVSELAPQGQAKLQRSNVTYTYSNQLWEARPWNEESDKEFTLPNMPRQAVLESNQPEAGVEQTSEILKLNSLKEVANVLSKDILNATHFNGVLCNLYRDGQDHMGFHSGSSKGQTCKADFLLCNIR